MSIHAIVLAGGLATRLYPLTKDTPKCLIPFHGRPFVDYILAWMAQTGVTRTTFVLGYLGEQAAEYLAKLKVKGLEIDWIQEGDERLGTGGAVSRALQEPHPPKDFLVVYGDSFLPTDFGHICKYARLHHAEALMTVFHNKGQLDTSNVHFKEPRVSHYSKDREVQKRENFQHIDYGISYWRSDFFMAQAPPAKAWDLAQLMSETAASGKMMGLEISGRFYEIGSPAGLEEFNALLEGKIDRTLSSMIDSSTKRLGTKT